MNYFIKNIHVNKLFHLENFDIPISDAKYPHLIITGKNGSGKTVLLNTIANLLEQLKNDENLEGLRYNRYSFGREKKYDDRFHSDYRLNDKSISCDIIGIAYVLEKYINKEFVMAFYQADRSFKMIEPDSPTKANVDIGNIRETASDQFIKFLVDLKFQELLAISNQEKEHELAIKSWFIEFEKLLKGIFQKENLTLSFNQEKKYTFKIKTDEQTYGFNEMSDGFKAAINIVADLILKMQSDGKLSDAYQKEGIVLIDEIETHLHLGLQKIIMPLLTKIFPNIQFIVTTHSPFVLSSMDNAVAFDLEQRSPIDDLTDYSYSSLAEGYFGVRPESNNVRMRLDELTKLLSKDYLTSSEQMDVKLLVEDFEKIPEALSPSVVGEFLQIKLKYADKIKSVLAL